MRLKRRQLQRISALIVLVIVLLPSLLIPSPAAAQLNVIGTTTDPALLASDQAENVQEKASKTVFGSVVGAVTTALINIMTYFANNFAHDAAVLIASGGNADEPLFERRPVEDYFIYAGASVASELINSINDSNVVDGRLDGFNVCAPPNLGSLRAGITSAYKREELEICGNLDSVKENWNAFFVSSREFIKDEDKRNEAILGTLSQTIDPNTSEFSASLTVFTDSLIAADTEAKVSLFDIIGKEGVWDVTDFITGQTTTPSSFVVNQYETSAGRASDLPWAITSNLMANSEALVQLGLSATSVFTNTLLAELTQKLADGLFEPIDLDLDPFDEFGTAIPSRGAAVEALRSLQTFQPLDATNYDLLSELSSCPSNVRGVTRRTNNCVIDTNFATVLGRSNAGDTVTVGRAIEEGLINGGWTFVPDTDTAKNQDSLCYQNSFCYSNLVKLRKARIVPIGWELAAQTTEARGGSLTLQEVVNGFNDCNDLNQRDPITHPFCHLIDPNWVLKMPETSCRILAHGQLLSAADIDARAEECVDLQTCIAEGENGECLGGFGYCVREKNTWRFRGDSCPAHAASCTALTSRVGENVNFLTTTIDQGSCSSGNAGCTWYGTEKEDDGTGTDTLAWPVVLDVAAADADSEAYQSRMYYNGTVETCREGEAGCTELIPQAEGLSLNIASNSSFELSSNDDGFADGWVSSDYALSNYDVSGDFSRSGLDAVQPNGAIVLHPGLRLETGSFYTLSYYARSTTDGVTASGDVRLAVHKPDGTDVDFTFTSYDTDNCTLTNSGGSPIAESIGASANPDSDVFERFECLFTVPTFADTDHVVAGLGLTGDAWIDDVMVENATTPSVFTNGYNSAFADLTKIHLKLPPAYLGCDGSLDQPEECGNYAQVCTENDAGCSLYTPTNGDPAVAGVVSELDRCDESCVGYDTYKQEETRYEPDGEFPVFFIPETADECSADAVGCDEFTNLETEELEYFTYLRASVDTDQAAGTEAVFYTWEGSDVEGYQLRTWNLIESNISTQNSFTFPNGTVELNFGSAPCTDWFATADGIFCDESFSSAVANVSETCDEHTDIFTNPDCREFYDADGNIHYRNWRDTVTVSDLGVAYRKTVVAGLGNDVDGNGLDDGAENCANSGGYFNPATEQCIYYGFNEESDVCTAAENGCREYTGGQSGNSRIVLNDTLEQGLINWDAASAVSVTFSNESIATDGHSLKSTGASPVYTHFYDNGAECTTEGGCTSGTGTLGGECVVSEGKQYCGTLEGELFQGKTYTLTFWAKGDGEIDVGFDINSTGSNPSIDAFFGETIELEADWNRYSLGPLNMTSDAFPDFGEGTTLAFDPDTAGEFFIDNVVLREGESNVTVIRDSWVTPAQCDENFEGFVTPQFQLGCMEYTDQAANTHYLKSFSRLCNENVVGCTAYYKTSNSDKISGETRNATCSTIDGLPATTKTACYQLQSGGNYVTESPFLCDIIANETSCSFDVDYVVPSFGLLVPEALHISYGPETVTIDQDSTTFAVFDSAFTCSSFDQGCQEVGRPTFSPDQSVITSWESEFLINDPDAYDTVLCEADELFCEEWAESDGSQLYFKHPQDRTCEYKTNVTVGSSSYDGWFRTDTTNFCYGDGTCSNGGAACSLDSECATALEPDATCLISDGSFIASGVTSNIWKSGDTDYDGWVGGCDAENAGCSEFQDPLDIDDNEFYAKTDGEAYFFKNNNNLDENTLLSSEQCDGQVSQRSGCVLFNDTGDPRQSSNASASLISSRHADELFGLEEFSLVRPIDCESGDSTITSPSGEQIDLCSRRCVYRNNKLESLTYDRGDLTSTAGIFTLDGSCFVDSDCQQKESDVGDLVSGTCVETVADPQGVFPDLAVPRLDNDTNRVLKVNRDRVCSEWLAQTDVRPVWDPSISQFRSISSGIDLCDEFAGPGDTNNCSGPILDDPAVVLDVDRYTSRDVTWYGEEYSGYAIPDIYPVQHLSQVNVAPQSGACFNRNTDQFTGELCEDSTECPTIDLDNNGVNDTFCQTNIEDDYRLAFDAGECSTGHAQACTVGYCSENGSPCSTNLQCEPDGGQCVTGECQAGDGAFAGFCDDGPGDDLLNGTCGAGETCNTSVATKTGSCYRDRCLVASSGDSGGFDVETEETQICRAFPEENSPFDQTKVDLWTGHSSTEAAPSRNGFAPYATLSGFEGANFCAPGETCTCSYRRLTNGGGTNGYISIDTQPDDANPDITGICTGGAAAGALCQFDSDCGPDVNPNDGIIDNGAACNPLTQVDSMYGLPGFCLERDSGINLQGDQNTGACITWLPIDELQGTTDLYAKFLGAGFFEDAYVCTETKPFANIRVSDIEITGDNQTEYGIACAETQRTHINLTNSFDALTNDSDGCWEHVACPDGFFGVVGQPSDAQWGGSVAEQCNQDTPEVNDCPYICVPEGSIHSSTENDNDLADPEECVEPRNDVIVQNALDNDSVEYGSLPSDSQNHQDKGNSNFGTPVFTWAASSGSIPSQNNGGTAHLNSFNTVIEAYKDCVVSGVEVDDLEDIFNWQINEFSGGLLDPCRDANGDPDYRCAIPNLDIYPGCSQVVKVLDSDGEGAVWTDRWYGTSEAYELTSLVDRFKYTANEKFGSTSVSPEVATSVYPYAPLRIGACQRDDWNSNIAYDHSGSSSIGFNESVQEQAFRNNLRPPEGITSCTGSFSNLSSNNLLTGAGEHDPSSPEIRSFINFLWNGADASWLTASEVFTTGGWDTQGEGRTTIFARITQIFPRIDLIGQSDDLHTWTYSDWQGGDPDTFRYDPDDAKTTFEALGLGGNWDVRDAQGNPPKVAGIDSANCSGSLCEEGLENTFSINGENSGDHESESGFLRATAEFFAYADKNQLPIRRVLVDWQDGEVTGSKSSDNFYKNHRGLQPGSNTESICNLGDEWGMTDDSCDENHFSYTHNYTCTVNQATSSLPICTDGANGHLAVSPCRKIVDNQDACVFQPRIHVLDNWGWCTGVCTGGSADPGCFEGENFSALTESNPSAGLPPGEFECNWRDWPNDTFGAENDPWVYYSGEIIVIP